MEEMGMFLLKWKKLMKSRKAQNNFIRWDDKNAGDWKQKETRVYLLNATSVKWKWRRICNKNVKNVQRCSALYASRKSVGSVDLKPVKIFTNFAQYAIDCATVINARKRSKSWSEPQEKWEKNHSYHKNSEKHWWSKKVKSKPIQTKMQTRSQVWLAYCWRIFPLGSKLKRSNSTDANDARSWTQVIDAT